MHSACTESCALGLDSRSDRVDEECGMRGANMGKAFVREKKEKWKNETRKESACSGMVQFTW